ncbi:MAG: molecular chaperone SurA, partial [Paraburkholderia sp.]|nr:molecular chaperone SurA [Paraburkholderia sp.]
MKKLRLAAYAASLFAVAGMMPAAPAYAQQLSTSGSGQTVDLIAAVVNDGVITQRELDERVALISRRLTQQ